VVSVFDSYSAIRRELFAGNLQLINLVDAYLQKAEERKDLNIFLEVFAEEAKSEAARIQDKINNGTAGKLAGMVVALKDNICYKNHHVSASSKILVGFKSQFSATVVERMMAEDAIIIGRTNCDEFAMGSSNENSAFGPVKNPVNPETVPGGSSGGSAAAVAAGMCTAALGSDTGGSIRQPASFTGTVGLKPTYGRVSRWGLIAYASSFDQIGPITRNVEDAALLLSVIAGQDEFDSTSSAKASPQPLGTATKQEPGKIAYLREGLESAGLNEELRSAMQQLIDNYKAQGYTVEAVDFPFLDYLIPTYYVLTTAEASSNLARFDGIHYGYRSPEAAGIEQTYVKSRSAGFGTEVKRRIILGTFVLSSGYYDAYYGSAQRVRRVLRNKVEEIFSKYDFILTPTTVDAAFKFGEKTDDPIAMYLQDIFTVLANLVGMPAISIPLAKKNDGLPLGVQLMSPAFTEDKLLIFSQVTEQILAQE
jgi:aspartyl-tRNA(Asn)/glutamyl-tRNA(Gln) amidotransferase subunit A